jgi:hypothetical protein
MTGGPPFMVGFRLISYSLSCNPIMEYTVAVAGKRRKNPHLPGIKKAEGVGIEPTRDNAIAPRTSLKELKGELMHRQFPPHSGCCHHYRQPGTNLLPGVVATSTSIAAAILFARASFIDIQLLPVQLLAV